MLGDLDLQFQTSLELTLEQGLCSSLENLTKTPEITAFVLLCLKN